MENIPTGEITFEMAVSLGIIKDDSLKFAYDSIEGHSILSPATDIRFELTFRSRKNELRENNKMVYYRGDILKVV
jgi:hypothetical protein